MTQVSRFFDGLGRIAKKIWDEVSNLWEQEGRPLVEKAFADLFAGLKNLAKSELDELLAAGTAALEQKAAEGLKPKEWLKPIFDAIENKAEEKGIQLSSTEISGLATVVQGTGRNAAIADNTTVEAIVLAEREERAKAAESATA
jgi:hypothetical protein